MFKKAVASKEQVKLMIGLTGPSGSGKTFSALQLAYGITGDWSKITLVDTENRSALYYAGERTGNWEHIDFSPTLKGAYHPENWCKVIEFAEQDPKTEVLILDSISHEWNGEGGCLQLVEAYSKGQRGNTFTPWKTVTPLHTAFVDRMRNSRLHVIATMRASTEYSMDKNEHGKSQPKKIGLKPVQRDGIDYEFGIMFDIDISHHAIASKDRSNLFSDRPPFLVTDKIGALIHQWAKEGTAPVINSPSVENPTEKLLSAFSAFGLGQDVLEKIIKKQIIKDVRLEPADREKLVKIYQDLRDKIAEPGDVIAYANAEQYP